MSKALQNKNLQFWTYSPRFTVIKVIKLISVRGNCFKLRGCP